MMTAKPSQRAQQLIHEVARRQQLDAFVRHTARWLTLTAGIYALMLLASRLTAWLPPYFSVSTLLLPPTLALLFALLSRRRQSLPDAARLIDRAVGDEDLFLTVACIDRAPGAYKALVLRQAEEQAARTAVRDVLPFDWRRPLGSSSL